MKFLPAWCASSSRSSALPLALFRILFGLCLVFDITALIEYAPMWFDPTPWIDPRAAWITPALYAWLAAAVCLTLGAFSRIAAVLNYLGCVCFMSFHAMPLSYEYHLDNLYLVASSVIPFLPIGRVLSIDALRHPPASRLIGPGAEIFFALLVSSIYLDSAIWKLGSSMWMHGLGYWTTAVQPWEGQPSLAWTLNTEWVARSAGYITLIFELVFIVAIWFRRIRLPLLAIGFALHIGIGTILPIPLFGLIMVSFLVALLPIPAAKEGAPVASSGPAAGEPRSLGARLAPYYYSFWGAVFLAGLADPVMAISREGFGGSKSTHQRFWYASGETATHRAWGAGVFWTYRFFGFRSHPIFIDSQFSHYTHQTRLRFHDGDPIADVDEALASQGEGVSFYPPHRNRRFLALYYRTIWPLIPIDHVETRLTRFLDYHAGRGSLEWADGWVTVEQREVEMPVDRWVHGQHSKNVAQPWRRVGLIAKRGNELDFTWRDPCWPTGTQGRDRSR